MLAIYRPRPWGPRRTLRVSRGLTALELRPLNLRTTMFHLTGVGWASHM
jgi:hypothetical protein